MIVYNSSWQGHKPCSKVLTILCEIQATSCYLSVIKKNYSEDPGSWCCVSGREVAFGKLREDRGLRSYHLTKCFILPAGLLWGHRLQEQILTKSPSWGFRCLSQLHHRSSTLSSALFSWVALDGLFLLFFFLGFLPSIPTSWNNNDTLTVATNTQATSSSELKWGM